MTGQSVFITGIGGGVGAALGAAYRRAGWYVIGSGRTPPEAEICDAFVEADLDRLARESSVLDSVVAAVREAAGHRPLAALVNNAATQILAPTPDITPADWVQTLNVNLTAPFLLSQAFLSDLEAASGVILNIGSVHAQATKPQFVAYATSKAALHGLTRALAVDLGSRARVVCLAPAAVSTPMLMAGFEGHDRAFQSLEACHPAERICQPEEVADAALFLTSSKAGFVTGTTFWLDGGVLSRLHDPV